MQQWARRVSQSFKSSAFDAHQLWTWLSSLAPVDLSVNEAAAARPGHVMMTGVGSPNDELWSQMERVGWTHRIAADDLPMAQMASTYAFTEAGARAVTTALTELVARRARLMGMVKGFDPRTAPEHLARLCGAFSWLALRTEALRTLARGSGPVIGQGLVQQRAYIQALDEISKGLSMDASCLADAIAHGLDSDAGRNCLERTAAGLRYAEQCLTQWTTDKRSQLPGTSSLKGDERGWPASGSWLKRFVAGIRSRRPIA